MLVHRGVYQLDDVNADADATQQIHRDSFVTMSDIYRLKKDIDAETTRIHPDDGQSTLSWVERL